MTQHHPREQREDASHVRMVLGQRIQDLLRPHPAGFMQGGQGRHVPLKGRHISLHRGQTVFMLRSQEQQRVQDLLLMLQDGTQLSQRLSMLRQELLRAGSGIGAP